MLQNKIPSDILHYFVTESPFLSLREQLNRQVLFRVKGQLPKKNLQEIKKQKQVLMLLNEWIKRMSFWLFSVSHVKDNFQ